VRSWHQLSIKRLIGQAAVLALFQVRARIIVPANVALDKMRQTLESGLAGLAVGLARIK
jgi:hypothetical protein